MANRDNIEVFYKELSDFVRQVMPDEHDSEDCPAIRTGRVEDCTCDTVYESVNDGTWMARYAQDYLDEHADVEQLEGWYFWVCVSGCMPEDDPSGPYSNERDAWFEVFSGEWTPCKLEYNTSDDESIDEDEDGKPIGWSCPVTFWTSKVEADVIGGIEGSSWEKARDMEQAYCIVVLSFEWNEDENVRADAYTDKVHELVAELEAEGLEVECAD